MTTNHRPPPAPWFLVLTVFGLAFVFVGGLALMVRAAAVAALVVLFLDEPRVQASGLLFLGRAGDVQETLGYRA